MTSPHLHLHFRLDLKESCNDCRPKCCSHLDSSDEHLETKDDMALYVKKDGRIIRLKKKDDETIRRANRRFQNLIKEKVNLLPIETDEIIKKITTDFNLDESTPITLAKVKAVSKHLDELKQSDSSR